MKRIHRRRFLYLTGLSGGAVYLGACGGNEEATSQSGEDPGSEAGAAVETNAALLDQLTIGVNNPNYASQLPIFVALDQGYYADAGLGEIEVLATDEYIPGLIGGSLQLTQGDTDGLIGAAAESGEPITYLGTYRGSEWRILGVGPDVSTVEDLRGQAISGGTLDDRNTFLMRQVVEELGLDPDADVEFVPIGGNSDARLQAIIAGQIQGGSLFPRHQAQLEAAGGKFLYEELFPTPQEGIAAMGPFLAENRATVVAYLTANIRARQYLQDLDRQDEVIAMMRENDFDIPEEFEPLYAVEIEQISPDGGFEAEEMDEFIAQSIDLGNVPEGTEWRELIDLEPLWEAQEANDLPQRPDPSSVE